MRKLSCMEPKRGSKQSAPPAMVEATVGDMVGQLAGFMSHLTLSSFFRGI